MSLTVGAVGGQSYFANVIVIDNLERMEVFCKR